MQLELPTRWQRDYDVYDRLEELGIDLGRREDAIAPRDQPHSPDSSSPLPACSFSLDRARARARSPTTSPR